MQHVLVALIFFPLMIFPIANPCSMC